MSSIRRVRVGDTVTASRWNEVADKLRPFSAISVAQGSYLEYTTGPSGTDLVLRFPKDIFARLSGASSPYSWTAVTEASGGTTTDRTGGLLGGTTNLYEINGKSGLAGKVVPITWTAAGDWRFQWVGYGCNLTFLLNGCNFCPIAGASVDFVLGGVTVFSGTTDSLGRVLYSGAASGTYTFNWSHAASGYSGSKSGSMPSPCVNTTISDTIAPTGTDVCVTNCALPIPPLATLFVTDGAGTRNIDECVLTNVFSPANPPTAFRTQLTSVGSCVTPRWRVRMNWTSLIDAPQCPQVTVSSTSTIDVNGSCARPILISGNYGTGGGPLSGQPFTIHE